MPMQVALAPIAMLHASNEPSHLANPVAGRKMVTARHLIAECRAYSAVPMGSTAIALLALDFVLMRAQGCLLR